MSRQNAIFVLVVRASADHHNMPRHATLYCRASKAPTKPHIHSAVSQGGSEKAKETKRCSAGGGGTAHKRHHPTTCVETYTCTYVYFHRMFHRVNPEQQYIMVARAYVPYLSRHTHAQQSAHTLCASQINGAFAASAHPIRTHLLGIFLLVL